MTNQQDNSPDRDVDELANFRQQFRLPYRDNGQPIRYFCGHSLGLQPIKAAEYIAQELDDWHQLGVDGHFLGQRPWLSYHERLTPGLAKLCGALPSEVVAMNSLTVNLHLMLASFYRPTPQRYKILIERGAFPSDRYAVASQIEWHGYQAEQALLELSPRADEATIRQEDIADILRQEGEQIAVVLLPGVQYLTGQVFDVNTLNHTAQQYGCVVGFDLAHAIGNIDLKLHDWNVDFAVWCGYKYLNGGPGAIAGCFVHERHDASNLPRLAGWWGHNKANRFNMPAKFEPLPGAEGWQISNPPILAMSSLLASLELFQQAGLQQLRQKTAHLTGHLRQQLERHFSNRIDIITPDAGIARGAQLSLQLRMVSDCAKQVRTQLDERGFICDWREPNIIRIAPVPLYNSFADIDALLDTLQQLID
jgi:kynureninase